MNAENNAKSLPLKKIFTPTFHLHQAISAPLGLLFVPSAES